MTLIKIETRVKADLDTVWKRWTEPDHIVKWYFATDEWSCPEAVNDLQKDGKFDFRMEARDGSLGFNFTGKYLEVDPKTSIRSVLDDGRQMNVTFTEDDGHIIIHEEFDAEKVNSEELQRQGWQAILNSFAKYAQK